MSDDDVKPGNTVRFWGATWKIISWTPAAPGDPIVLAEAVYVPGHSFSWPISEFKRHAERDVGFKVLPSQGFVA